jgi:hypothetical protein
VRRDSLFGDRILWSGKPKLIRTPREATFVAVGFAGLSLVSLAFAIAIASALAVRVSGMVLFSAWCATLALLAWRLPRIFRAELEYQITERHVIWKRGRLRRSIDRSQITFARIVWDTKVADVGDLVLVRAVPTGALRRTLTLTLSDVEAPDRVWATVRGVSHAEAMGDGGRPVAQRLEDEEKILWTGVPQASPWTVRRGASVALAATLLVVALRTILRVAPALERLRPALSAGSFALLLIGVLMSVALVVGASLVVGYASLILPVRLVAQTRYYITSRRVLLRRGHEELSLDRRRIAHVVTSPTWRFWRSARALSDLHLILEGPRARGVALSGAFGGETSTALLPVLGALEDADQAAAQLAQTPELPSS